MKKWLPGLLLLVVLLAGCASPGTPPSPGNASADAKTPAYQDVVVRLKKAGLQVDDSIRMTLDGVSVFGVAQTVTVLKVEGVEIRVFDFASAQAAQNGFRKTLMPSFAAELPKGAFRRLGNLVVHVPTGDPSARITAALD